MKKIGKYQILDFGIAKPVASPITQTGARLGTPWYMSPEQIKGKAVDQRSDIFSFGVFFYELLAYQRPFEGDDTAVMFKIVQEEPESLGLEEVEALDDLQAVVSKCLAKNVQSRYANFAGVAKQVDGILAAMPKQEKIKAPLAEARTLTVHSRYAEAIAWLDEVLAIDAHQAEVKSRKQECEESRSNCT